MHAQAYKHTHTHTPQTHTHTPYKYVAHFSGCSPVLLCGGQVNYVVQEAIVVIRDIFRKYPGKCLSTKVEPYRD